MPARLSQNRLRNIATFDWLARSQDLSLIKHVWDHLGRQLLEQRDALGVEIETQIVITYVPEHYMQPKYLHDEPCVSFHPC